MLDIVGLIAFSVMLLIVFATSYAAIVFGVKNKKLAADLVQLNLDKIALLSKLEKELEAKESKSLEQTDGFVKFLSQSRDWAFTYIEDAQKTIQALKDALPNGYYEDELKALFDLLPENNKEKNNE